LTLLEHADGSLTALLEDLRVGVYIFDLEDPDRAESLRFRFANRTSRSILGVEPTSVVGRSIGEVFPESLGAHGAAQRYREVVLTQTHADLGVVTATHKEIAGRRFTTSAYPLGPSSVAVLFDDFNSNPKRTTELAAIVDSAHDAILSKDLEGRILTWNAAATTIYGYAPEEAVGRPVAMLLPADRPDEIASILERLRLGERITHFETKRLRKDGTVIDVSLTISPIRDAHGNVVGATTIGRDVTAAKIAQDRMRDLAAIVETSEDAILSRTLDGTVKTWNAAAERLFGYSAAEMIGSNMDLVSGPLAPDVAELRARLHAGSGVRAFTTRLRHKDGAEIDVSIASSPIRDDHGEVVGIAAAIRDMTEHSRLEEQLRQSQKLEAIGTLASGVAHDFNNILTVIRGYAMLLSNATKDESTLDALHQIEVASAHAAALTQQLLAFSRQQVLQPMRIDLTAVVAETLQLVSRLVGDGVELVVDLDRDTDAVLADKNQLQQVILNLCGNARDAMPQGGRLAIRTGNVTLDETYTSAHAGVEAGRYVLLEISDSGLGMDEQTQQQAFDPFFTTCRCPG